MKTSRTGSESETPAVALRRRAEGIARGKAFRIPENMESLSVEAARQMLHELRVHQIELEMQNEELRRVQAELDAARARYFDLYDLAPVGYFTLSEKGLILEANLTAATLLGVARGALVKQPIFRFLLPEDQDIYYRHRTQLFETHLASSGQAGEPQACELRLVKTDGTAFWGHLAATAAQDADGAPVCRVVLSDITDRKRAKEELQQTLESLRKAVGTTIQVMVSAVETRDPYTAGHQVRSANLARTMADEMGLPQEKIDGIRVAGSIHDIGKLSIPAEILSKPTKLSEIEFSLIKEHARQGYEILRNVESPWPLAEMVYQHHERMDGSGYPRGLKGEEILIEARILAVSDVVESMASHRPYRAGLGINAALEEIEKNRGTLYDEAVADACLRLFREKGYRFAETRSILGPINRV
ncbi:MAG: HD domain-containing protein [Proteobacteria bacterium]|nr:HD domain-containing protein [Pseudomonadota bacterium]MCG2739037.1 HD domain-containing protein [Syntrophaceae bacterium]